MLNNGFHAPVTVIIVQIIPMCYAERRLVHVGKQRLP